MRQIISIVGLSAALSVAAAAAAHAVPAIGLVGGNTLFNFDTTTPGLATGSRSISGLTSGETLFAIDFRPATSVLYGLGSTGKLYTIDLNSGTASLASTLSVALSGGSFDISFNPTVDRLRIVGTSGQDLRVNVDTGAVTIDGMLAYAMGDANAGKTPGVTGAGYTNQVGGTVASTVLYDIDGTAGLLVTQSPPNNGTLNTVGALGVAGVQSLDIDGTGTAYAATSSAFYRVNLTTGAASLIGSFGNESVSDFVLVPTSEPISLGLLGVGLAGLAFMRRGRGAVAA